MKPGQSVFRAVLPFVFVFGTAGLFLFFDHLLLSPLAADRLIAVGIDKAERGLPEPSDHVPVWCELDVS